MPNKINGKKKPQNKAHYSEISKHRTFIVKKKRKEGAGIKSKYYKNCPDIRIGLLNSNMGN